MAEIDNPKKSFQFGVIAAGLNELAVQEVDIPDFDLEQVEHGGLGSDIKTAGKIKYGNIKLTKLRPLGRGDNWIWDWIQNIRDQFGGGQLASQYKRTFDIVQYSYDNVTITDDWKIMGAWPTKLNGINFSRMKSDNTMEEIELSVDKVIKVR